MNTKADCTERLSDQTIPEHAERPRQERQERLERIPEDWRPERKWRDEQSGMTVDLRRDYSVPWPKFGVCIGRARTEGDRIQTFLPVIIDTADDGVVSVRHDLAWFAPVFVELQEYCSGVCAENNEEQARVRAERDVARAARSTSFRQDTRSAKPKKTMKPRIGKTARDRENKRKRSRGE